MELFEDGPELPVAHRVDDKCMMHSSMYIVYSMYVTCTGRLGTMIYRTTLRAGKMRDAARDAAHYY